MKFKIGDLVRVRGDINNGERYGNSVCTWAIWKNKLKISVISQSDRFGMYALEGTGVILFDEEMLEKATMEMIQEKYFPDYKTDSTNKLIVDKYNSANDEAKSLLREIFKEVEGIQPKNIRTFPVLKKWKGSSLIVLFNDEKSGTVVSGDPDWEIGISERSWVPYDDNRWEDFTGEIILKNE